MAESEAQPQPIRNPELWFSDGNLVIQAGNHQFRVFSGILAAKSPVFQDMFSFSQPPGSDTVEGSPLVRLPDSSEDTGYFLNAIFHFEYVGRCHLPRVLTAPTAPLNRVQLSFYISSCPEFSA
jgi:hypothetical protein